MFISQKLTMAYYTATTVTILIILQFLESQNKNLNKSFVVISILFI